MRVNADTLRDGLKLRACPSVRFRLARFNAIVCARACTADFEHYGCDKSFGRRKCPR